MLCQAIEAIQAQTRPPERILVIDDGSTDGTGHIVRQRFGNTVELFRRENGGRSAAINTGIEQVNEDYIWVFDDDDIALPNALARHLAAFSANPTADFTYSTHRNFTEEENGRRTFHPAVKMDQVPADCLFHRLLAGWMFSTQSIVIRTAVQKALPYRPEFRRSQDYEFVLRLTRQHNGVYLGPEPSFLLRAHNGVRGANEEAHAAEEVFRVWRQYEKRIIGEQLVQLPLNAYLPGRNQTAETMLADKRLQRRALLYRAAVALRVNLVDSVVNDLQRAGELQPTPLSALELREFKKAAFSKDGMLELAEQPAELLRIRNAMQKHDLRGLNTVMAIAMLRTAQYQFIDGEPHASRKALRSALQMFDWSDLMACASRLAFSR
jgi:glycosyltransferase involved in cell wall biosynthesis